MKKNDILGLLGANRTSKFATINGILGFLNSDSGDVIINDMRANKCPFITKKLNGYIAKNVNFNPYLTSLKDLGYCSKIAALNYTEANLRTCFSSSGLNIKEPTKK